MEISEETDNRNLNPKQKQRNRLESECQKKK